MPTWELNKARCHLICVGSELLRGKINTHASYISRRLASIGLSLNEESTVGDELAEITTALRRGLNTADVVIVSGGLGPTFDDLTREAAAEATGRSLILAKTLLRGLRVKFRRAHYPMPAANVRQAYLLKGAEAIGNQVGTAPGQWLEIAAGPSPKILILLPGPPSELYPMLENFVLPRLRKLSKGETHLEAHLHFVGVPESVVDHKVRPIIEREQARAAGDRIQFTILARLGLVDFDVFISSRRAIRARTMLKRVVRSVRGAVGRAWYGSDKQYPLEKVVGERFRAQGATLAVAESCTGGLLAARLTEVSGSSDYFLQGWVVYSNAAKLREIGVPARLLSKYGAVSRPVALALARGAQQRAQSTWAAAITGIAGPAGGTASKPVGLVFIALASGRKAVCYRYEFFGNRDAIRERAVLAALDLLRQIPHPR